MLERDKANIDRKKKRMRVLLDFGILVNGIEKEMGRLALYIHT